MTDNIITKDEAIDRKKAGLPCETWDGGKWIPTPFSHFDLKYEVFRKPPEPRKVARDYWILEDEVFTHFAGIDSIHVREVLPGDVVVSESALASALNAMLTQFGMDEDEWNKPTFDQARRALGLLGEGS